MAAELADVARSVIDANSYMALGTADEAGNPWVSPVWFASEDYRTFHWVSSPDAKHSRNLAAHPQVAIAIFDSSVPVGGAQAVYMKGVAGARARARRGAGALRPHVPTGHRPRVRTGRCAGIGPHAALSRDSLGALGAPGPGSRPWLGGRPQRARVARLRDRAGRDRRCERRIPWDASQGAGAKACWAHVECSATQFRGVYWRGDGFLVPHSAADEFVAPGRLSS